ncbi:S41 family peptidase [Elusimicrobiota bacterium]
MRISRKRYTIFTVSFIAGALLVLTLKSTLLGTAADSAYQKIRIIVEILDQVQNNYVEETKLNDLVESAANGIIKSLDPFSQYLPPKALNEMRVETEGQFGGIGIRVGMIDDWLTVITPLPGTPAFEVGLFPKDRIVKINGESTEGITLDEAVEQLRGKPKTKVNIHVERILPSDSPDKKPETIVKKFTIIRRVIKIMTTYSRMVDKENGIGYIRITEFNAKTAKDLDDDLVALTEEGMKALVLDLRFNPGGLLPSAINVAKEFIGNNNMIVYTKGRARGSSVEYKADSKAKYGELPLIALINEGSASGSEILAGALQDNKRAILIGNRTFGKASVQSLMNLSEGSGLRLTTGYYYTPSGRLIHKKAYDSKKKKNKKKTITKKPTDYEIAEQVAKDKDGNDLKKNAKDKEGDKKDGDEKETWGIDPDIKIKIDQKAALQVHATFNVAYFPDGSKAKPVKDIFKKKDKDKEEKGKEGKETEKEEEVRDVVLERAIELFKTRDILNR